MGGRWRNFIGSRLGFLVSAMLVALLSLSAGLVFDRSADSLRKTQAQLEQYQNARGITALSDLTRLNLYIMQARNEGEVSESLKADIQAALDILYTRAEHIRTRLKNFNQPYNTVELEQLRIALDTAGAEAAQAIQAVIDRGDAAVAGGFTDVPGVAQDVTRLSEAARASVFHYLNETELLQERLVARQSGTLVATSRDNWLFLGVIALAGVASLALLRREVVARILRAAAERRAEFLAYFDPLTDLPNRVHFQDRFSERLAAGLRASLLMLDLDRFKDVNDKHGQAIGNLVLKEFARRLDDAARAAGGCAARLAGDEFAVFIPAARRAEVEAFCARLTGGTVNRFDFRGEIVKLPLSIGAVAAADVGAGSRLDREVIMRLADFALAAAKRAGGNCTVLYDVELERRYNERQAMIQELPSAIRKRQLEVYFQSKVRIASQQIYGFEALVRWRRNGEIVPPGEFIGAAEESGLILDLDRHVLDRATEIIAAWNRRHGTRFSLSVNLSALHILNDAPLDFVPEVLARHALQPDLLTLEITESVELDDWEKVERALIQLRHSGCRISIDDFGTGYSSLAYLRTISADELKIDKSLIAEIETSDESMFIVDAVLDLARSLRLNVVVEGIERPSQADVLRELGCEYGQGYLYGRPEPAEVRLAEATYGTGAYERPATAFTH